MHASLTPVSVVHSPSLSYTYACLTHSSVCGTLTPVSVVHSPSLSYTYACLTHSSVCGTLTLSKLHICMPHSLQCLWYTHPFCTDSMNCLSSSVSPVLRGPSSTEKPSFHRIRVCLIYIETTTVASICSYHGLPMQPNLFSFSITHRSIVCSSVKISVSIFLLLLLPTFIV